MYDMTLLACKVQYYKIQYVPTYILLTNFSFRFLLDRSRYIKCLETVSQRTT